MQGSVPDSCARAGGSRSYVYAQQCAERSSGKSYPRFPVARSKHVSVAASAGSPFKWCKPNAALKVTFNVYPTLTSTLNYRGANLGSRREVA